MTNKSPARLSDGNAHVGDQHSDLNLAGARANSESAKMQLPSLVPRSTHRLAYLPSDPRTQDSFPPKAQPRPTPLSYEVVKRVTDIVLSSVLLAITSPLILIAASIIRWGSPGSPFFVQTRHGRNGRPFKLYKLRGMYIDARQRFPALYDYSNKTNLEFCFHEDHDPRVTKEGRFFRRTSIDELPNLWNVLLGDMSLVGPRPEIPEVLALYGNYKDEYLSVKPGVTCFSKCTGRDRLTKRETIEFDIDYVRRRSLILDGKILLRTFCGVVLRRDVL